jgi:sugar lactone lactonase YvrE
MRAGLARAAGRMFGGLLGCVCAWLPAAALAQSLPPIYERTPVEPAPASTVVEFPKGSFLENIAADGRGRLFVTSYLEGKVWRVEADGRRSVWADVPGTVAGIALNPDGSAVLSGWIGGKEPAVFSVDAQGRCEVLARLPQGQFPNGVLRLAAGRFLVADSYRGAIWVVDTDKRSAAIWLEHASLGRADAGNPTPGVNGLKLWRGAVYASNTARQQLLRIPVVDGAAGTPEVLLSQVGIDDFAFDAQGNLYGATHVYNSVVRITREGRTSVVAGLAEGMAGSTAVAVVPLAGHGERLYVVTNGGMSLAPAGGLQPARVVRVEIAAKP